MSRQISWFVFCFLLIGCASQQKPVVHVVCREIIDGDTCIVEQEGNQLVIRLVGIDAWELSYSPRLIRQVLLWKRQGYGVLYTTACEWGTNGRKLLQTLIPEGSGGELHIVGRDLYGRFLGSLYVSGEWINEKMVESGWAMVYLPSQELHPQEKRRLLDAEQRAKRNKKGIWATFSP
ncbi:MAG: thermonuclease family protein [Brevinematales bacterium]|nr:thermonuclease family protein [Brevinematales bacterium]